MMMILKGIECLLIDMDGVILDNTYDNDFWQNQIPRAIARKRNIKFDDAKRLAIQVFTYKKNTKDWYDLDYWSNMLDVDIEAEKKSKESLDKIMLYEDAQETLKSLKKRFRMILITNAHRKTLDIKLSKYDITEHFDEIICAHELYYVKEDIQLWYMLRQRFNVKYDKTLLIEDTLKNIKAALSAGVAAAIYLGKEKITTDERIICLPSINEIFSTIK